MDKETTASERVQVYELGVNLVPIIAEEAVGEQFQHIKKAIEAEGGKSFDEQFPRLINLAYTMAKRQETGFERFDSAYFGWIKFEANPDSLETIKEEIEGIPTVLRYLLIKATRENTVIGPIVLADEKAKEALEVAEVTEITEDGDITSISDDEEGEVTDEAIDKGIEELVGEEDVL